MGWVKCPYDFIATVSFRVVPGAAILKPSQPNKFRNICNASVRVPNMADSAVGNGNGLELPVASNTAAILLPYLPISWLSIERVCVSLHILADPPSPPVSRSRDAHVIMHIGLRCSGWPCPNTGNPAFSFSINYMSTSEQKWASLRAHT